ncbi:MAG: MAPEG family protein [Gammaproteobacteria bacterium]|nr:MAPEG family protein [Gammaproteobacteria bacterium]
MNIEFTAFYAGLLGLLYVVLSIRVIKLRKRYKIGINSGQEKELERAIRVHGNFSEYVPMALFLILLLEINQTSSWILHTLGAAILVGRILHAMGLDKSAGVTIYRTLGMVLTFLTILVAAVFNILAVY